MSVFPFRALLFDLDGTLLQVEMRHFISRYVAGFHARCCDLVDLDPLHRAMRAAIHLLLQTETEGPTNEDRFFAFLAERLQLDESVLRERFALYLANDLESLSGGVRSIPEVGPLLELCLQSGVPLALATNPVFPRALTEARCRWVGIDIASFAHLTYFENSHYCKPQGRYFLEVATELGVEPESCLMIGNDTSHDLSANLVGMTTWLLDPFLLEREGPSWKPDHRGNHQQLHDFISAQIGD